METAARLDSDASTAKSSSHDDQINKQNKKSMSTQSSLLLGKLCKHSRPKRTFTEWAKHYFWQGQELSQSQKNALELAESNPDLPWYERFVVSHRRLIGVVIPAVIFHFFWWAGAIKFSLWNLFVQHYTISLMMMGGAVIAGMTCEGGGAVAFPVMTLVLHITPEVSRDFVLLIQSCGMTAATFTIFFMRIKYEWHAAVLCSIGGVGGIIFSLEFLDSRLSAPIKKMIFVSVWFAFAVVLCGVNLFRKRRIHHEIQKMNLWKGVVLVAFGIIGGIFSGLVGSGLDICSFSVLTLLFGISEKIATPTSLMLMALNSLVGMFWRAVLLQGYEDVVWEYFAVAVPVVVIVGPIASALGSHFHRLVLAALVLVLDTVALITAFVIVPMTVTVGLVSGGFLAGGFAFFGLVAYGGHRLQLSADACGVRKAKEAARVVSEESIVADVETGCNENVTVRL